MLNLCWSNIKRFLSVLVVFGKYFVFTKTIKIFKTSVALFWRLSRGLAQSRAHTEIFRDSLAGKCPSHEKYLEYFSKIWIFMFFATHVGNLFAGGRSSCKGYIEIFTVQHATSLRVDLPVAKNTQKNFQESCFQSVSRLTLATGWRLNSVAKIACFAQIGQFLNVFSFPSNISDCSLSSSFTLSLKLTVLLLKNLYFCIISFSNLQGKGMGFLFLTSYFMIMVLFS